MSLANPNPIPIGNLPNYEALLLDRREAAHALRMSVSWLDQATARGEISVVRIGRSVRYDPRDLAAFIDRQKQTLRIADQG